MNKYDGILFVGLFVISIISFLIMIFPTLEEEKLKANLYYENKLIDSIDLYNVGEEEKTITLFKDDYPLFNDDIQIVYKEGKIKVLQETSAKNICSKQGYIKYSYQTIVCLPNHFYIELISDEELDGVVS